MDTGLIFGIIFAAIVMSLLVFFGLRYINDMMSVTCESQIGQQITNLRNTVKSTLSLSRDSSQEFRILFPGCAKKICFVDVKHPEIENPQEGWTPTEFTNTLVSSYKYSFLVFKPDNTIEGYTVEKFKPYVNFCISSSRDVILRNVAVPNTGTMVEITLPEF